MTEQVKNIWWGTNENAELSNLAGRPFEYKGRSYVSVEHAYQTWKSGKFCEETYNMDWAEGVKRIGRKRVDVARSRRIMKTLIHASIDQNPTAKLALIKTHPYGLCHRQDRGVWRSYFPQILMELRDMYIDERSNGVVDYLKAV